ncbi:MAG: ABC transporter ATP-binding protein [Hydrogenophaga sp.]|uniref:ABC transporter ATP-binding protein n=1 Tax=Hydrogenophaga sp. TaxID=1904254 RepID=UPI0025BAC9BC|nr:ABC transporter ATP-binding protein [Hydrogenophaga sp.]MBU7573520.1 ABC transporter ATP-binding protein [Hydrogenophaga sp.]
MTLSHAAIEPVLTVHDLTVQLPPNADRLHAVDRISFEVFAGQTTCLLGESGSGKSVIAQTVMRLLPPAVAPVRGSVRLLGEDVLAMPTERLRRVRGERMAMIFQEPMTALNPVMTCGQQLDEMLAVHTELSSAERRERILEVFGRTRLPSPPRIFGAYPHQLSGGQRQRVMIAMALILKPALLICDEPTTALDVTTQAEILKLIRELQRENGTAVLFITHDFGVVAEIADHVVVMRLGEMVEQGPKLAVLQAPREPYTRMLLSAVPGLEPVQRAPVAEAAPLIEARGLAKTYSTRRLFGGRKDVHAARGVSLRVRPGETVGIVGESGSGKSTVARCIARLIDPSAGEVLSHGEAVQKASGRRLKAFREQVQVVFQDPYRSLNPRQTVGESIIEGAVNAGQRHEQAWARAEELMRLVRLRPDALHRYPHEFSGGQRQRICIARALACNPQVLIADEAVSALDVSVQAQILELLDDIQQRLRIGLLFITHDLRVANQICDRIIVMHQGAIVEEGPAHQVFSDPAHAYTRALLDSVPGRGFAFHGAPA